MAARGLFACLLVCVVPTAVAEKVADIGLADDLTETGNMMEDYSDLLWEVKAMWQGPAARNFAQRAEQQLSQTQGDLAPILATLTRDESNHYEPSAVRYALHHYFVRKFGWHLKGLDPAGAGWNTSEPTLAVALNLLPKSLHSLLERRLRVVGLDAKEVAIFALLLKHLIHENASARLAEAYKFLHFDLDKPLDAKDATYVLDMYMAAFLVDRDLSKINRDKMMKVFKGMERIYPRWPQMTELDQRTVQQELQRELAAGRSGLRFAALSRAREAVDEEFGFWQAGECRDLKQMLLTKELDGTGRTTLTDFYAAGLNGHFQFRESVDWLRELGALDESVPGNPRVIIENYVIGASNTVGSTPFHDIRCISDCEALYGQLERNFVTPGVAPEELAAFVSQLAAPSSKAPGAIGELQRHRLQEIAAEHGGYVPLSGRMFAQWMHHIYPRECPYPHVAGTTAPVDYFTNMRKMGSKTARNKLISTIDQMKAIARQKARKGAPVQMAPWESKEELPAHFEDPTPAIWLRLQFGVVLLMFSLATAKVCSQACGVRGLLGVFAGKRARKSIEI